MRIANYFAALSLVAIALTPQAFAQIAANPSTATYQIVAKGMCCQGCAKKIAGKLYTVPGVLDVKADVPNRMVTVIGKPSAKLTLERIWQAVEQGKGAPSQLSTAGVTYKLTLPEQLTAEERATADGYAVAIADMHEMERAQKVAGQLRTIRGVKDLSVDLAKGVLFVQPAANFQVSPFALITAVQQAQEQVTAVTGPYGRLSIEPIAKQAAQAVLSR